MTGSVEVRTAGDSALVVELGSELDPGLNARVIACAAGLRDERIRGVRDVISSYAAVTVCYDPLRTDLDALTEALTRHAVSADASVNAPPRVHEVPVCYGGANGPDLELVAGFAGCSADEVVRRHSETSYRVYLLGFVPGFAYLGRVGDRIAMPRRRTPRMRVPAGAVGIAGGQTGIYPYPTPGGWQLIGRTPLRVFDAARDEPFLFAPGDTVRFLPIDEATLLASLDEDEAGTAPGA